MKKALLIIVIAALNINTVAQNTYIPDDNFEQALIDLGYDNVLDNYVVTSNISGVEFLSIASLNIQDLTGIEDFTDLTHLYCYDNQLTGLDVSANTLLETLACGNNQITSLDVSVNTDLYRLSCYSNLLTSLDVSANTALTDLTCSSNQLTSLNLSANTALTDLSCSSNQLTSLDLSANTALTYLSCGINQLTVLDVSANTALTHLSCFSNQLTSLDVSANTALTGLFCRSNQITNLDVSANSSLTSLGCSDNQLTGLNVSANSALDFLTCYSNLLTSLDVSANTLLESLACDNNQLTSLDVSLNTDLYRLTCYSNLLTSLDLRNGNNNRIVDFVSTNNPNLKCILVDDKDAAFLSEWDIDPTSNFVETETECDALYIKNFKKESSNIIYPNPSEGIIYINFQEEISIKRLIISDITGRRMIEKKNVQQNDGIDLSDLDTGIYIIDIQTEIGIITSKIIKR